MTHAQSVAQAYSTSKYFCFFSSCVNMKHDTSSSSGLKKTSLVVKTERKYTCLICDPELRGEAD